MQTAENDRLNLLFYTMGLQKICDLVTTGRNVHEVAQLRQTIAHAQGLLQPKRFDPAKLGPLRAELTCVADRIKEMYRHHLEVTNGK